MSKSLLVAVWFHEGRYHGQADQFSDGEGWPPSPARLFQALVAAAARGALLSGEDQQSLRWLEHLMPPKIVAPIIDWGRPVKRFVPNNDLDSVGGDPGRIGEIRVGKQWRPCFFDANQPVTYAWDFESETQEADRICIIASRLCQLGRGVDMAWAQSQVLDAEEAQTLLESQPGALRVPAGNGNVSVPRIGTLDSLTERYRRNRVRLKVEGSGRKVRQLFSQPPKALFRQVGYDAQHRHLHFELRLSGKDGFAARPLASVGSLVPELRDRAAQRLRETLPEKTALIDKLIVGRNAGPAELSQRIRIVPLPSVGTEHTDPSIRRIMVEVPPNCPWRMDDLAWAFAGLEFGDLGAGSGSGGMLLSTDDDRMAKRFIGPAREFQSITPLALPAAQRRRIGVNGTKTAKERCDEEQRAITAIVQALRHSGVTARPNRIDVQREPFQRRGARAERFAAGTRFPKETLWHVAVTFTEPVSGPLVLGDGRYLGLGLMRPIDSMNGVEVFSIENGLADNAQSAIVAQAARRAMMARVQSCLDRGQRLSTYVSGHEVEGTPSRKGDAHRHVAVVADLPRRRILYLASTHLHRTGISWREIETDHKKMAGALEGMAVLRAGTAGCLSLGPTIIDLDNDPLFAPARIWESVTDYDVTRHSRRVDEEEALRIDVASELQRRGWPSPENIEVLRVNLGPRGGLSGRLRLTFATAQPGALVIGRSSHKGGGLFANADCFGAGD